MQNDERDRLTPDDARFVERLRTHYAPPPLGPAQRAAFDARLRERLERPRWRGALLPGFAAASLAALAVWWLPTTAPVTTPAPASQPLTIARSEPAPVAQPAAAPAPTEATRRAATRTRDQNLEQVLFYYGDPAGVQQDAQAELPPEFAAIDGLFFDDV